MNFLFFLFYQSTALSSHAACGWPSNVFQRFGRRYSFNNWYRDLPIPPLSFTEGGGEKVRNLVLFSTSLYYAQLAFENAARYPYGETNFLCRNDRSMSLPSLVKLGPRTPENRWAEMPQT